MPVTDTNLSLLCWDDARCVVPLAGAARRFEQTHPRISIELHARSLADFNDQSLDQLVVDHDIVVFDHPMVPQAAERGLLVPLLDCVDNSIGASQQSFVWQSRTWGLAFDFACHVSVSRPDLLETLDETVPQTWTAVADLVRRHPDRVALPMFHGDMICALLSITAAQSGGVNATRFTPTPSAVELLSVLCGAVDDDLYTMNPPQVLDRMVTSDRWAYCPLLFGYARYSARTSAEYGRLRWHDAPRGPQGIGSLLGGAGLGVSAKSSAGDEAQEFVSWCGSAEAQRDFLAPALGQPPSLQVWNSADADDHAGGFYSDTRLSAECAVRRPAHPRWPEFQRRAGLLLWHGIRQDTPATDLCDALIAEITRFLDHTPIRQVTS